MSCCGGNRAQFYRLSTDAVPSVALGTRAVAPASVLFQYTGTTGLTVSGPITGRRYRFNGEGAQVEVDGRDAPSFAAVPRLQRLPRTPRPLFSEPAALEGGGF